MADGDDELDLTSPPEDEVKEEKKSGTPKKSEFTYKELSVLKVPALKDWLRKKGLKVSGKKEDLINRLLGLETKSGAATVKLGGEVKKVKRVPKAKTPKAAAAKFDNSVKKLIAKLNDKQYLQVSSLSIRKNKYNNFEHQQTGLVFHPESMMVNSRQKDGKLVPLTKADIELCIKHNLPFEVPENMNIGMKAVQDKNLEELNDDDFHEESEDEEEEEEDVMEL